MSEPESKVLEKLFKDVKPHAWVNVHSGMEAIFTPYDHKNEEPERRVSRVREKDW